jgi:hypothetical protein
VREQKRSIEIEGDQTLPIVERQLVDVGAGIGDDRAATALTRISTPPNSRSTAATVASTRA